MLAVGFGRANKCFGGWGFVRDQQILDNLSLLLFLFNRHIRQCNTPRKLDIPSTHSNATVALLPNMPAESLSIRHRAKLIVGIDYGTTYSGTVSLYFSQRSLIILVN